MNGFLKMVGVVWNNVKKYPCLFIATIILMYISYFINIYINLLNKIVFDEVFYKKNVEYLSKEFVFFLVLLFFILLVVSVIDRYINFKLYSNVKIDLYKFFYSKVIYSNYTFFNQHSVSDIYYRMFGDINSFYKYILDLIINIPVKIVYMFLSFIILFSWSSSLTGCFLVFIIFKLICVVFTKKYRYKISSLIKESEQETVWVINDHLHKISTIKIFGIENAFFNKFSKKITNYGNTEVKCNLTISILNICNNFFSSIWSIVSVIYGAILVCDAKISIGEFIAFTSIASTLSTTLAGVLEFLFQYPQASVSYARVEEYIQERSLLEYGGEVEIQEDVKINTIKAEKINFKYPAQKDYVFDGVSFVFRDKDIVQIDGVNGRGKTTLANILMRLISNDRYQIYMNETNIFDIEYNTFRKMIAFCPQKIDIFNESLWYNLKLEKELINKNNVINYVERFKLMDGVVDIEERLNMIIGDTKYKLSAGNIQKIGIIRVLLSNAKILIFDEPISNLDHESKRTFVEIIKEIQEEGNRIIIIISHDKETEEMCNVKLDLNIF